MAKLSHEAFTRSLAENAVPLSTQVARSFRGFMPQGVIGSAGDTKTASGFEIADYAEREGRGRELLVYLATRGAEILKAERAAGRKENLFLKLSARDIEDATLADSLRLAVEGAHMVPEAITFAVPLMPLAQKEAFARPALLRLRLAGFSLAYWLDSVEAPTFNALSDLAPSALCIGSTKIWRQLRTIGPGRLGAFGTWLGWAEATGLKRFALDIDDDRAEETARLYGITIGAGAYVTARASSSVASAKQATG